MGHTLNILPATTLDYRRLAEKRLPRFLFDYIEGGANDEITLANNVGDFQKIRIRQRVLKDVSNIDTSTMLAGEHRRGVDVRDVFQYPLPDADLLEVADVVGQCDLVIGAAFDVIEQEAGQALFGEAAVVQRGRRQNVQGVAHDDSFRGSCRD